MFMRKFVVGAFAAGSLASATVFADTPTSDSPCILDNYETSVTPLKMEQRVGKVIQMHLAGALVHVTAQPGLSAEWLRLRIGQRLASNSGPAPNDSCVFDLDVRVEVDSAATGYDVKIIAEHWGQAKEVLRRAESEFG